MRYARKDIHPHNAEILAILHKLHLEILMHAHLLPLPDATRRPIHPLHLQIRHIPHHLHLIIRMMLHHLIPAAQRHLAETPQRQKNKNKKNTSHSCQKLET